MANRAQTNQAHSLIHNSLEVAPSVGQPIEELAPLQFCFNLQSTLELYNLMKIFHQNLKQVISYQSFSFNHRESKHKFEIGKEQTYHARYDLKIDETFLGEICISKSVAFTQEEIIKFENLLSYLLLPLRNALRYEKAIKLSMIDPLTNLFNRQAFDLTLNREIEVAKRHRSHLSLLVLDIDFFKQINDTHGHQAGDQTLISFSEKLKQIHRQSDMIFRYGGEEFGLILPNTHLDGAVQVAERICKSTAKSPVQFDDKSISMTVSIGIATYLDTENAKRFFSRADGALYSAKAKGRNQVCIA